jgi:hypothetical protein
MLAIKILEISDVAPGSSDHPVLPPNTHKTDKTEVGLTSKPVDPSKRDYTADAIAIVSMRHLDLAEYVEMNESANVKSNPDFYKNMDEKSRNDLNSMQKTAWKKSFDAMKAYFKFHKSQNPFESQRYAIKLSELQVNLDSMLPASKVKYNLDAKGLREKNEGASKELVKGAEAERDKAIGKENDEYKKLTDELNENKDTFGEKIKGNIGKFMSSNYNVVVRSFESTGGKGLAGFIESIAFDWMASTWDTDMDRKAPKMCKVTVSFAPLHDISPGLDSMGHNRAPIYPLGPYKYNG